MNSNRPGVPLVTSASSALSSINAKPMKKIDSVNQMFMPSALSPTEGTKHVRTKSNTNIMMKNTNIQGQVEPKRQLRPSTVGNASKRSNAPKVPGTSMTVKNIMNRTSLTSLDRSEEQLTRVQPKPQQLIKKAVVQPPVATNVRLALVGAPSTLPKNIKQRSNSKSNANLGTLEATPPSGNNSLLNSNKKKNVPKARLSSAKPVIPTVDPFKDARKPSVELAQRPNKRSISSAKPVHMNRKPSLKGNQKVPTAFDDWGEEVLAAGDQALPTQMLNQIKPQGRMAPVKPQPRASSKLSNQGKNLDGRYQSQAIVKQQVNQRATPNNMPLASERASSKLSERPSRGPAPPPGK